jgi:RimJ/RimL family protein N-acetyltransferase
LASQKVLKKNNFKIQGRIKKFFSGKAKARDKIIFVKNKK